MLVGEAFEPDAELKIARSHNILDFKVTQLYGEAQFTNLAVIQFSTRTADLLTFGASADHFARFKDESSRFWLSNSHDTRSKALWIILRILGL